MQKLLKFAVLLAIPTAALAQKMTVKVIDRRSGETGYSYQVPGRSTSNTSGNVNCNALSSTVNCTTNSATDTQYTAARNISYSVTGSTLALLLPDGRVAVVNCVSKYKLKMDYINRRGCRTPIANDVDVEFSGKAAKLRWPTSIDGKKFDSETYSILGVLPKQV